MGYNIPTDWVELYQGTGTAAAASIPEQRLPEQSQYPAADVEQSDNLLQYQEHGLQHSHHQLCSKHSKQLPDPAEQPLYHLPAVPRLLGFSELNITNSYEPPVTQDL